MSDGVGSTIKTCVNGCQYGDRESAEFRSPSRNGERELLDGSDITIDGRQRAAVKRRCWLHNGMRFGEEDELLMIMLCLK
ncbi:hypothetical protein ACLOJK_035575, partial [Asimina triloba]